MAGRGPPDVRERFPAGKSDLTANVVLQPSSFSASVAFPLVLFAWNPEFMSSERKQPIAQALLDHTAQMGQGSVGIDEARSFDQQSPSAADLREAVRRFSSASTSARSNSTTSINSAG